MKSGLTSELVEQALEVGRLAEKTRDPEIGRGHDAQSRRGRDQGVLAQAADRVGVRDHLLAGRLETRRSPAATLRPGPSRSSAWSSTITTALTALSLAALSIRFTRSSSGTPVSPPKLKTSSLGVSWIVPARRKTAILGLGGAGSFLASFVVSAVLAEADAGVFLGFS